MAAPKTLDGKIVLQAYMLDNSYKTLLVEPSSTVHDVCRRRECAAARARCRPRRAGCRCSWQLQRSAGAPHQLSHTPSPHPPLLHAPCPLRRAPQWPR